MLTVISGIVTAIALIAIAALHGYWALGGYWPGHDEESLARKVVGGPPGMRFPSKLATWGVALILVGVAIIVLGTCGIVTVPAPIPFSLMRGLTIVAAIVFGLRGLLGFFIERLRPAIVSSPFVRLNRVVYSPICLILTLLILFAVYG